MMTLVQTGWLKHIFLPVLKVGKYKIRVPVEHMSGEALLPDLETVTFLLCVSSYS